MTARKILAAALIACLTPTALAASAAEVAGQADAQAHNAAYEAGTQAGLVPETLSEMLTCSAVWDRWRYAVESAADTSFTGSLRRELAAENAKMRSIYWLRQARREVTDEEGAYFKRASAAAETQANTLYAAYVDNEDRGMEKLLDWLGFCQ